MRKHALSPATLCVLTALLTLTAACGPETADREVAATIAVEDAWIRAVPPNASATAGYFVLENRGDEDLVLEAARATGISRVEIHETTMNDGVMRMRRLQRVVIPAGDRITFAPGGRHLMLFADALPAAGSTVTVELAFAGGRVLEFEAPVRRGKD